MKYADPIYDGPDFVCFILSLSHFCHHVVVSMGQESRHCFSGSPAQGLSQVAIREVARAGVSSEAQMEKDPLSSSRDGWQDSVP